MQASIDAQRPFVESFAQELAGVIERMTGEPVQCPVAEAQENVSGGEWVTWRQEFAPEGFGPGWVAASLADATGMGRRILAAAGIGDVEDAAARATYLDLISNAFSTVSRPLSQRLGEPVSCGAGREDVPPEALFLPVDIRDKDATTRVFVRFDGAQMPEPGPAPAPDTTESAPNASARPQTLDLLLDVELPVSVSFGSAELPLKEVVKLTAGSIVELNRGLSEPVELIVNNCVIARGEAVIVDGNFGIRILEVVSRQERLRTVS